MMQDLSIALIQTNLHWEDIGANLGMFEEKIWQLKSPVDLIILPEMFNTGFSMNAHQFAEPMNSRTMKWMKQMAAQTKAVVTGSLMIKEDQKFFNRLIWMEPNGTWDQYDKKHTFKLTGENEIYTSGDKKIIKVLKNWKVCPLICYDLRFPVWSRNRVTINEDQILPEYDLLIYVSNWPASRSHAWATLLKARAIENSCYTIGSNILGKDGRGFVYEGSTLVCSPLEVLQDLKNEDTVSIINLSYEQLIDYRIKYPFLLDGDRFDLK